MKTISVVIAAYNAEAYLRETLESIFAQDYPAIEIIVVDDGSRDGTAAICKAYEGRVQYRHQANSGGCSVPRNHGFRVATGEYVCFFDADDLMAPNRLAAQARFLDEHPEAVAVLSDYRNFDERGPAADTHFMTCHQLRRVAGFDRAGAAGVLLDGSTVRAILIEENFSIAGSPLYRRETFAKTGGFDESLKASEDFELLYRVASMGAWGVLPTVGFHRRLHQNNMSWDSSRIIEYKIRSRAKLLSLETSGAHRRLLRRALSRLYRQRALFRARHGKDPWLADLIVSGRLGRLPSVGLLADFLRCIKYSLPRKASAAAPSL